MPFKRLQHLNTKECLWIYILKILTDKPIHAYVIRKEIQERFGFMPGTVTAYKVLYQLKRKGLVEKRAVNRTKTYSITQKGRAELKRAAMFYREMAGKLA